MKEIILFHSHSIILGDGSIKVIIIDSGIHYESTEIEGRLLGQRNYYYNKKSDSITFNKNCLDENGHGTQCIKIIDWITRKKTEYYIIKILDRSNRANSEVLTEALKHALTLPIQVICLSLATVTETYKAVLEEMTSQLYHSGKIIVSSLANENIYSFPASFTNVIGVKGCSFNENKYYFNKKYAIQCLADSSPVITKINNQYREFRGNSKANALMTGNILNLGHDEQYDFDTISDRLEKEARGNVWEEDNAFLGIPQLYRKQISDQDTGLYRRLQKLFMNYFRISEERIINQEPIWMYSKTSSEIYSFLSKVEDEFRLNFKETVFTMNDIYCIDNFYLSIFK